MKAPNGLWFVASGVGILAAAAIGYGIGAETESVQCEEGLVISLKVTERDRSGNGNYTVDLGDCPRLSDEAIVRAIEALVGKQSTTTTTTVAKP
jgi:hypothetical protein